MMLFVGNVHTSSRSKKKGESDYQLKETKNNFLNCFDLLLRVKENLTLTIPIFCTRWCFIIFGGNFSKEIFAEKVARENSVQIGPNFPAKSLSIYTKNFPWHLFYWFNYLSYNWRNTYKKIKIICWIWNFGGLLSRYWETIKVDIKTDLLTLLLIIQENKYAFTANEKYFFFKKKPGACVL